MNLFEHKIYKISDISRISYENVTKYLNLYIHPYL
uniref:Uncharacterized protein n=1 Tax=Polysiphonia elongata TaxID=159753 RepID=A0A1Z1MC86_9FLOR|nr:hypothetical protein [Polysiphonia elongata]ARW63401.1 hypothetical protein [Polysiphonia elongata]